MGLAQNVFKVFVDVTKIANAVKDKIKSAISEAIGGIKGFIEGIGDTIKRKIGDYAKKVGEIPNLVYQKLRGTITGLSTQVKGILGWLKGNFSYYMGKVWEGFNSIKTFFSMQISNLTKIIWNGLTSVQNAIKNAISYVYERIKGTVEGIVQAFQNIFKVVFDYAKNVVSGVVSTIKGIIQRAIEIIKTIASELYNVFKFAVDYLILQLKKMLEIDETKMVEFTKYFTEAYLKMIKEVQTSG